MQGMPTCCASGSTAAWVSRRRRTAPASRLVVSTSAERTESDDGK
jgi:hypothetical protein